MEISFERASAIERILGWRTWQLKLTGVIPMVAYLSIDELVFFPEGTSILGMEVRPSGSERVWVE